MSAPLPWFKFAAAEWLLDSRLDELGDGEFRAYVTLLAKASLQNPRWTAAIVPRQLARLCWTTPAEIEASIRRLAEVGLIVIAAGLDGPGTYTIPSGDAKRFAGKPSDSREAAAERKRRQRERSREDAGEGVEAVEGASRGTGVTASRDVTRQRRGDQRREDQRREEEIRSDGEGEEIAGGGGHTASRVTECEAQIVALIRLWESGTGTLVTPMFGEWVAAELEGGTPFEWLRDAIEETALQGKRAWKYTRAILVRWREEGREVPAGSPEAAAAEELIAARRRLEAEHHEALMRAQREGRARNYGEALELVGDLDAWRRNRDAALEPAR